MHLEGHKIVSCSVDGQISAWDVRSPHSQLVSATTRSSRPWCPYGCLSQPLERLQAMHVDGEILCAAGEQPHVHLLAMAKRLRSTEELTAEAEMEIFWGYNPLRLDGRF